MAGHLNDQGGIEKIISGQMSQPTFPVPLEFMGARMEFEDFRPGDTFSPFSGTTIKTCALAASRSHHRDISVMPSQRSGSSSAAGDPETMDRDYIGCP